MSTTHTRTHTEITFADPYMTCNHCGVWVPSWHNPDACGCGDEGWENHPCGHQAGATSVCPSWSPVDGCTCADLTGMSWHPVPPADVIGDRVA